uniref:Uncharacterized protein n=1 Tax=Coccidioides posadasii RMSCC 3488 TaxID=454284 RepID=A0A0J6F0U4_COCPO|nr:hypothetical protein CPAG_00022 [Coccidioides posadasii RMSCC 3488]
MFVHSCKGFAGESLQAFSAESFDFALDSNRTWLQQSYSAAGGALIKQDTVRGNLHDPVYSMKRTMKLLINILQGCT